MKVVIKIGSNPENEIINYTDNFYDDKDKTIDEMIELLKRDNITIVNASMFLLYITNNLIMRNFVSKNKDITLELKSRFNLNPDNIKIFEVDDNEIEHSIQEKHDMVGKNYYNDLMKRIMDDFYKSLNYYE